MLEYGCSPTLRQRTAKLLSPLIVADASLTAVSAIFSMCEVVCIAGETEETPKTRVSLVAVSWGFFVFM
jgi:hypothetical protein